MQLLLNALIAGSFAALLASGLALVYGVMGVFNLALGQMALVGGYVCWWCVAVAGLPLPVSIACALLVSLLLAWVSFDLFVEPFQRRHHYLPLVTTIALSMLLDGLILIVFHEEPRSILAPGQRLLHLGEAVMSIEQLVLICVTVLFLSGLVWVLASTSFGRKVRATVQHPEAAASLGMNGLLLRRSIFIMSALCAAGAGIYLGIDQNLSPTLGLQLTVKAYAAVIAGGRGSLKGAILFAFIIALLEQLAIGLPWFGMYIPAGYQGTVALLVIVAVLLWKPEGAFGSRLRTS
jgi:branched-chain amino acid transport system permease protein